MLQLVSFDTLGTLLRVDPAYYAEQAVVIAGTLGYTGELATLRVAVRKVRSHLEHDTAQTGRHYGVNVWLARIAQELDLPLPAGHEASRGRRALVELQKYHALRPVEDDLVDVLVELKRRGFQLAHICNTGLILGQSVREALTQSGLAKMIDIEHYSDECGYASPDKRVYRSLMRSSGLAPQEMLYVGSSTAGALEAGMQTLRYRPQGGDVPSDAIYNLSELLDRLAITPD